MESDEKLNGLWLLINSGDKIINLKYIFFQMYLIALASVCKLDFNGLWIVYKTTKHCIDAIQQWEKKSTVCG